MRKPSGSPSEAPWSVSTFISLVTGRDSTRSWLVGPWGRLARQRHGRLHEPGFRAARRDRWRVGRERGIGPGRDGVIGPGRDDPATLGQGTGRCRVVRRPHVDPAQPGPGACQVPHEPAARGDLVHGRVRGEPPCEPETLAERDELVDPQVPVRRVEERLEADQRPAGVRDDDDASQPSSRSRWMERASARGRADCRIVEQDGQIANQSTTKLSITAARRVADRRNRDPRRRS
jgi:hypothetical protein